MISNSSDIDFIHGAIHGRWCEIVFYAHIVGAQNTCNCEKNDSYAELC